MSRRPRRTTIKDVAEAAGVSPTTVSFILNDTPNTSIGDATKARVHSAVADLGYRPNAMAQGLRRSRSNTIGFITDQVASTPYAGEMIHGAQQVAWARGSGAARRRLVGRDVAAEGDFCPRQRRLWRATRAGAAKLAR